jgi:hypothetical protein
MSSSLARQASRSLSALRASRLHQYLMSLPDGGVLPPMKDIAEVLSFNPSNGAYLVCCAFDMLESAGHLRQAHGTVSKDRGHRIVRMSNGRVLKTYGCPLVIS